MKKSENILTLLKFLQKLPGVGERTSERYLEIFFSSKEKELKEIGNIIMNLKKYLNTCPNCFYVHFENKCPICSDKTREQYKLMVVKEATDAKVFEQNHAWKGKYHIIGGVINPLKGVGPEKLRLKELKERIEKEKIKEVLVATNFDSEGNATAYYIKSLLKNQNIKLTRLARGLPTGADVEYMDKETLEAAIENRK